VVAEKTAVTHVISCESLHLGRRLQDVSLSLGPGLTVAVVGPNGAGKSTLIQALAGLLRAQGRIRWNGRELSKIPFLLRGRTLAWLGQESHAEFAFPVRDVVAQGRHAWGNDDRDVERVMEILDILDLAQRPVTELSGGERRRVFLARALATQAPLQLWDEPTSNQDVRHSLEVMALAGRLASEGGTLLVSLHDLRQAFRFDRVVVLNRGRLLGFGKPHDVLTKDLIRSVFRVEATFVESLVLELTGERPEAGQPPP
jgi:iron complex transport system ATP-binding protein